MKNIIFLNINKNKKNLIKFYKIKKLIKIKKK